MGPAFFVSEFSAKILSILIKRCFGSDFDDISKKPQLQTIIAQLAKQGAKTIVCEREYIDNDYFDDFANYYVHSFKDYRGSCVRMHFFSSEFEQEDLKKILKEMNASDMEKQSMLDTHYLGFIVIRPLPFTFLAKACIKSEFSTLTRRYRVSLFGIRLNIESIGFQEQDRVVSACATTAVWSLLHALPEIHNKFIPSPSAITLNSFGPSQQNINTFPIKGLNLTQITATLESLRLRQHSYPILAFDDEAKDDLDKFSQFYLDSKIPIFMGAQIFKRSEEEELTEQPADDQLRHFIGDHAVVVIGRIIRNGKLNLIIHDDRYGPFLPIELVHVNSFRNRDFIRLSNNPTGQFGFAISGTDEILIPAAILVATFHKKKIGVRPIINTAFWLVKELKRKIKLQQKDEAQQQNNLEQKDGPKSAALLTLLDEIEYHARLYECHELKADYFKYNKNKSVYELLTAHLPHFVWRLRFTFSGMELMDLIFDATDTPNGNPYIRSVTINDFYADFLLKELKAIAIKLKEDKKFNQFHSIVNDTKANTFHIDVLRQMLPKSTNYSSYLDKTYGDVVSPKYTRDYSDFPSVSSGDKYGRHRFFSALDVTQQKFSNLLAFLQLHAKGKSGTDPKPVIWLIDEEGALVLGPDNGHPSLIGANPARIAGEIIIAEETPNITCWINYQSGRYSKQYPRGEADKFLENACIRWKEFFPEINFEISSGVNFIEILKNRQAQAGE